MHFESATLRGCVFYFGVMDIEALPVALHQNVSYLFNQSMNISD